MSDKPVASGKSSIDLIDKDKTFEAIDVVSDSSFLDLACGVGRYSTEIAARIGEQGIVYAIDLWEEGIAALNQVVESKSINNIKAMVADMSSRLPLEDSSIDACLLSTILHDLSKLDQNSAMQEVFRVLKPGGILNIIEFKKVEKGPGPPIKIRLDEKEVEELLSPYGLVKTKFLEIGEYIYLVKYQKSV